MRFLQLSVCMSMVLAVMTSTAARGGMIINSVTQGWSTFITGVGGGGGANPTLPLININDTLTDSGITATAKQTINGYIGPATLGQSVNAFSLQMTAFTDVNSPAASASTDFSMNFTLDFAENYSFTRLSLLANIKLLYQGLNSTSEIPIGTGVLGSGTYILQFSLGSAAEGELDLRIPAATAPEPASLSFLVIGGLLMTRRRLEQ